MGNVIDVNNRNKDSYIEKIHAHIFDEYTLKCTATLEYSMPLLLDYNLLKEDTDDAYESYDEAIDAIYEHKIWSACYEAANRYIENTANIHVLTILNYMVDIDFPIIEFVYNSLPDDYVFDYEDYNKDDIFLGFIEHIIDTLVKATDSDNFKKLFKNVMTIDEFENALDDEILLTICSVYFGTHGLYYISNLKADVLESKINITDTVHKYVSFNPDIAASMFECYAEEELGAPEYNVIALGICHMDNDNIEPVGLYAYDTNCIYKLNNNSDDNTSKYLS